MSDMRFPAYFEVFGKTVVLASLRVRAVVSADDDDHLRVRVEYFQKYGAWSPGHEHTFHKSRLMDVYLFLSHTMFGVVPFSIIARQEQFEGLVSVLEEAGMLQRGSVEPNHDEGESALNTAASPQGEMDAEPKDSFEDELDAKLSCPAKRDWRL